MYNMLTIIQIVNIYSITYLFEHMKLQNNLNTIMVRVFGVTSRKTINNILNFTNDKVY